jgi:CPA1 family monovalent cation:H+ antiporter
VNEIELILLLLVVVAALTPVARRLRVPYPVLLVVGGLVLALLPIVPDVPLNPELIFLVFLPPLVFRAAFSTSIRDFRVLLPPILSLAVGLVLATTLVVAVVLHTLVPELSWPVAFAFGAIVSPPDAVAAAAVLRGLGVPRKIVTLLEGESLINDATALVAYRAALGAIAVAFSASDSAMRVVIVGLGGVLVGFVLGVLAGWLLHRLSDPPVEITLSLLTPFATYLAAESLGVSGVLATVTAGLYLGWRSPYLWGSEERLRGRAVWDMVDFLLNGLVFILIGLQLSTILPALASRSLSFLIGLGVAISVALIVVRMIWVFADLYLRKWLAPLPIFRRSANQMKLLHQASPTQSSSRPKWKDALVVGWAGMRGVVSLAAALALPANIPDRDLLIFLTFFVILVTLCGQGLSLPWLIRTLGVGMDNRVVMERDTHARRTATEAALARLDELRVEWPGHIPLIDALQAQYEHRASHLGNNGSHNGDGTDAEEDVDQELLEHHVIRRAVVQAQRTALLDLRQRGELDDEVWRDIERDLDLEELQMDA